MKAVLNFEIWIWNAVSSFDIRLPTAGRDFGFEV
jgi:hypothetical protein